MRTGTRLAGLALAALLAGCALPPPQPQSPAPRGTTTTSAATPRATASRTAAPTTGAAATAPDTSGPSAEAQQVLASIPEPLSPSERVPAGPAASAPAAVHLPATESQPAPASAATGSVTTAAPDTSAATPNHAGEGEGSSDVPVPSPTEPLGERPGSGGAAIADSMLQPRTPAPPPPSRIKADTCWRVQIVAPRDKPRADRFRSAATSQLMVTFVVEHESGLYKVRSRDCVERAEAEALRQRALQSGFHGAFLSPLAAR